MPRNVNYIRFVDEVFSNLGNYSYYWDDSFNSLTQPRQTRRTHNNSIVLKMFFSIIEEIDVHTVSDVKIFDIKLKTIGTNNRNFCEDKEDNKHALRSLERLKRAIKPNEIFNLCDCKGNLMEVID